MSEKCHYYWLFLLLIVLAVGAGAQNDEDRAAVIDRLKAMDGDGDGRISKAEWKGKESRFALLDKDGDGFISKKEINRLRKPRECPKLSKACQKMDANGDGKISQDEWQEALSKFQAIDSDGDGSITREELAEYARRQESKEQRKKIWQHCREFDTDGDGNITGEEWQGDPKLFLRLDKNGDGVLTGEDVPQWSDKDLAKCSTGKGKCPPGTKNPGAQKDKMPWWDEDGDGKMSKAEWKGPEAKFDSVDTNRDGYITQKEYDRMVGTSVPVNRHSRSATRPHGKKN